MKPDSIRKFDMLYLGSIALGLVNLALSYGRAAEVAEAQMSAAGVEGWGGTALMIGIAIGTLISLGLWFLVSRMRIEFVKWMLALLVVYNLVMFPQSLGSGIGITNIIGIAGLAMQAAAIWFVFRPDAKAWFAEKRS